MFFEDLSNDIGADDWIIPQKELAERRFIKKTARYTIYKADWFGDVLVYEPNKEVSSRAKNDLVLRRQLINNNIEMNNFKQKLNELRINIKEEKQLSSCDSFSTYHNQSDSAYSSISSSPQFNKEHEFEFPLNQSQVSNYTNEPQTSCIFGTTYADLDESTELDRLLKPKQPITKPVILNRSSFCNLNDYNYDKEACDTFINRNKTSTSWFELNELRLVAHENFILFMGASPDANCMQDEYDNKNISLVMEMIKPESISLFNLLHARKSKAVTNLNRFFASSCFHPQQQHNQILGIADKLNICQQVTNAMTYLHDKNIVHGRLTSVNIYIEANQRVKISMIDNDEQAIATSDSDSRDESTATAHSVAFNKPSLTYLSPELVRSIIIERATNDSNSSAKVKASEARARFDLTKLTKESDVYAFGTLLYELFEEQYPFAQKEDILTQAQLMTRRSPSPTLNTTKLFDTLCLATHSPNIRGSSFSPIKHLRQSSPLCTNMGPQWNSNIKLSANELIFQIGSGLISVKNSQRNKCPAHVDHIISHCWSTQTQNRPNFKRIKFD